jgi:hypothetical protein
MTSGQQDRESEKYKQLADDHRFFSDMRFKQLTLWSGATALLLNAAFSDKSSLSLALHPFVIPFFGLVFTGAFWVMEVRSTLQGIDALEKMKTYPQWTGENSLQHWTLINRTHATLVLYLLSYTLWARQTLCATPPKWGAVSVIGAGVILIIFTIREYLHLWVDACKKWKL